jgi:tRNA/tmRNA/rRNA uracil-C5-methylase (TrmA/RlmC/RlmD family)
MSAPTPQPETAEIIDTLVDGRGVAQTSGKTVFVQGAIKGDKVSFVRRKKKRVTMRPSWLRYCGPHRTG